MSIPARKLRLALIGCGVIGRAHAERLAEDPRAELAVCCDPRAESAESLRQALAPLAKVETDAQRAIDAPDLDGVVICSPTLDHHWQSAQALDRGLHVLCEKPLASRREEIVDLIERAKRSRRVMSVSHQRRYLAPYATARRELTENADWYGPIREIHLSVCERWQQTITGTWRDDPGVGAGYFGDAGIHQVDIINYLLGRTPRRVFASSDRRGSRVEITTRVIAELGDDIVMNAHFTGLANHWREDIQIHCARGDLLLRSEELYRAKDNVCQRIIDLLPSGSPDESFVNSILDGRPVVSPPEIALPIFDWTQGVLASIRQGGWVELGS